MAHSLSAAENIDNLINKYRITGPFELLGFKTEIPEGAGTTHQGESIDGFNLGENAAKNAIIGASIVDGLDMSENNSKIGILSAIGSDGVQFSEMILKYLLSILDTT
ncbi:MAG: hypothetical protein ACWGNO_04585, partial [Desulfobacterales bacterium]